MKIYVAGEGPVEIGRWSEAPEHRSTSSRTDGVLFELLRKAGVTGTVVDGKPWRAIRKYQAGNFATAEQRTLRGLARAALEAGADLLVWARDTDHDADRRAELKAEHDRLKPDYAVLSMTIVGEPAHPAIEAWIVAIAALHRDPESLSCDALKTLAAKHAIGGEQQMVDLIQEKPLDTSRSSSLAAWVAQVPRL